MGKDNEIAIIKGIAAAFERTTDVTSSGGEYGESDVPKMCRPECCTCGVWTYRRNSKGNERMPNKLVDLLEPYLYAPMARVIPD